MLKDKIQKDTIERIRYFQEDIKLFNRLLEIYLLFVKNSFQYTYLEMNSHYDVFTTATFHGHTVQERSFARVHQGYFTADRFHNACHIMDYMLGREEPFGKGVLLNHLLSIISFFKEELPDYIPSINKNFMDYPYYDLIRDDHGVHWVDFLENLYDKIKNYEED